MSWLSKLFGGGDDKTTSKTKNDPYGGLPDWAEDYFKEDLQTGEQAIGEAGDIYKFLAENPEFVAQMSPEEKAALGTIMDQAGVSQDLLGQAEDTVGDSMGYLAKAGSDDVMQGKAYESDYLEDVVDTTLAGMRREGDRGTTARNASVAGFGGMNNTRGAVADAVAGDLLSGTMAKTEAELRSDAEKFAADYGLKASAQYADLANTGLAGAKSYESLAGSGMDIAKSQAAAQGTYGQVSRDIDERTAAAKRNVGKDAMSWYADVFNATRQPPSSQGGTTTVSAPGPSPINQGMGTALQAAGLWTEVSDLAAKEDIRLDDESALDKLARVGSYSYRYRDGFGRDREPTSGLMAQDLERSGIRGAVKIRPDGIKVVDPYPVLATVVKAVRELDARSRPGAGLGAG